MSSAKARRVITEAVVLAAYPTPVFDVSDYVSLDDALGEIDSTVVLIQYAASGEELASVGADGNQCWEETGGVVLHYIVPTGFESEPAVQKCDKIRYALRGKRLSREIACESVSPFVDFGQSQGITGAWKSWVSNMFYVRRLFGEGDPLVDPGTAFIRIIGAGDIRITGDGDTRIVREVI